MEMYLSSYRPPYHDEMIYSWIACLAYVNFPMDYTGIQLTADILFPYSKTPERRGVVTNDGIRKDFIRGLSPSIRRLRENGYMIASPAEVLTYNTPLAAEAICRSEGTNARFIHTAMSEVTGTVFDMPKIPDSIKTIRVCPQCMQESRYVRMWHTLPGVSCCAVHGTKLLELPEKYLAVRVLKYKWSEESPGPGTGEELRYARIVKEIYDNPSQINIDLLRSMLPSSDLTPSERATLFRKSAPFQSVVSILSRLVDDYKSFLTGLPAPLSPKKIAGRYSVVSTDKAGIMAVRCPSCGLEWTDHVGAIKNLGCPECLRKKDPDKWAASALRQVGDGQYVFADGEKFTGMGSVPKVLHQTCGKIRSVRMASLIWEKTACQCEMAYSTLNLKEKFPLNGFDIVSYTAGTGIIELKHLKCGKISKIYLQDAADYKCRYCHELEEAKERLRAVTEALGPGYEISVADKGKLKVIHKPCGTTFFSSVTSILHNRKRCPLCTPYLTRKRADGTVESLLYQRIRAWLDDGHNVWIAKDHIGEIPVPYKKYSDALLVLVKKGYIQRVSYGIYSDFRDLKVYDILQEKYLMYDNGEPAGSFTGAALEYVNRNGKDPELITLESEKLIRKSKSTVTVCGRKVIVKGK